VRRLRRVDFHAGGHRARKNGEVFDSTGAAAAALLFFADAG